METLGHWELSLVLALVTTMALLGVLAGTSAAHVDADVQQLRGLVRQAIDQAVHMHRLDLLTRRAGWYEQTYLSTGDASVLVQAADGSPDEIRRLLVDDVAPQQRLLDSALDTFDAALTRHLLVTQDRTTALLAHTAGDFTRSMVAGLTVVLGLLGGLGWVIVRRRDAHRRAETTAAELAAVLDSLPDAVFVGDAQRVWRANASALALAGARTPEELEGGPPVLLSRLRLRQHADERPLTLEDCAFHRALGGDVAIQEVEAVIPGAPSRVLRMAAAPVRIGAGVFGAVMVSTDITEARERERRLRLSERKYASVISMVFDAIITVDREQRIQLFNSGAERIFGYTADEVVGQPLEVLLPDRFRKGHRALVAGFLEEPDGSRCMTPRDVRARRRSGEEFVAAATIAKVETPAGVLMTAVLRDVTEERRGAWESQYLAATSDALGTSIEEEITAAPLGPVLVPEFADGAVRAPCAGGPAGARLGLLHGACGRRRPGAAAQGAAAAPVLHARHRRSGCDGQGPVPARGHTDAPAATRRGVGSVRGGCRCRRPLRDECPDHRARPDARRAHHVLRAVGSPIRRPGSASGRRTGTPHRRGDRQCPALHGGPGGDQGP